MLEYSMVILKITICAYVQRFCGQILCFIYFQNIIRIIISTNHYSFGDKALALPIPNELKIISLW